MNPPFQPGEPAPWFYAAALDGNPRYAFNTTAGRWILMLFIGRARAPEAQAALDLVSENRNLFNDVRASFFGVTVDPADAAEGLIAQLLPGIRWFLDYDGAVSAAYRARASDDGNDSYSPFWLVLDPAQRVCLQAPLSDGPNVMAEFRRIAGLPYALPAPVLIVPGVLPPAACRQLIALYDDQGGAESGFMREVDGITKEVVDYGHKRRADHLIADKDLILYLQARIFHVLRPMVRRAFQFDATRIERFNVACYDSEVGGYFRPHRDNTTKGTAHRKFAVTINLDTSSYEGGDLSFPEFGPQTYRAPTGGAVVFSCSLLHEAKPVTKGRRYAFLPFLYDDAGALLREANLAHVAPELQNYRSGLTSEDSAARDT